MSLTWTRFTYPFTHWIVDGLIPDPIDVDDAAAAVPHPDWEFWVRYDNDCEFRKRTCEDRQALPTPIRHIVDVLNGKEAVDFLSVITGVPYLIADPTRRGAGLHVTEPGGWLQPHLDYALHPTLGMERRVNLIMYLDDAHKEDGGQTILFDDAGQAVGKVVQPRRGMCLVWCPGDVEYHAAATTNVRRSSIASYYLTPPRPHATRKRALFVPRRPGTAV